MPNQFSDFYNSLDTDSAIRGKQFEHFVKWFLMADPEWSTQVEQVWLWNDWPGRWGADCGIDLVFRHKNGEHWAVQAKCYSPDYVISKHDVDKFLSESNRPSIKHRLLIASTDRIGGNAKQVCEAQEKPVVRFLLSDFERAALDYPANFLVLSQGKRKDRPTPNDDKHEHQLEAISTVVRGLQAADRGQLIMACGTGKTYVTLWIKEQLDVQRTLVLAPSLGLLSQLLREWTFAANTPFEVLCVCSDQTVGTKSNDEPIHSVADLAFPVTSDAEEVRRFLTEKGRRVVFSTYQSSSVITAAHENLSIPAFDLTIADEAHRCAGKVGSEFTTILDNTKIRSVKRLFATATPRTYSKYIKKSAKECGIEVVDMDDAKLFGEVLYSLPFGAAIARNLLTDYRVVIIGVDDPTIAQWIANRKLVSTDTGIETDTASLAAQIGLLKAIKDYDLKRVISFHNRVNRAERFTNDIQDVMAWVSDENRPTGTLRTDFVSGSMPASKRRIKLDQLKALGINERGILSNARCLSEGVDVPSLDGVAFIDPRSSQVDIIQAVGRAIRLSPEKKSGTVVLPVFISSGQNTEETLEGSHFKPIWDVLNALKAHDDVLACELDQIRAELGRKLGTGVSADRLHKISIDLPISVGKGFGSLLRTYLVERTTDSWDAWLGQLQAYKERFGHCNVGVSDLDYAKLGSWVSSQRTCRNQGYLSKERIGRLEEIGFIWGFQQQKSDETWMKWYGELKKYAQENGDPHVPKSHTNTKLASWVWIQRIRRKKVYGASQKLTVEQVEMLDKLGFHWDARFDKWMAQLENLKEFKRKFGNCNVEVDKDNYLKLYEWLNKQRSEKGKGVLPTEREAMLNELGVAWNGGSVWDANWQERYAELKQYFIQNGNSDVPSRYRKNTQLSTWVSVQRQQKKMKMLADEKTQLLNEIGFTWKFRERGSWEDRFAEVIAFKEKFGHCNIPVGVTDPPKLGAFVNHSRVQQNKGLLSEERKSRLDAVGFVWNNDQKIDEDGMSTSWKTRFNDLLEYKKLHGNCDVPQGRLENGELGNWVGQQRQLKKQGSLHQGRIQLLENMGFSWGSPRAGQPWEIRYLELLDFKSANGNCDVPTKYAENLALGSWVVNQRQDKKRGKMSVEHERLLNDVGFIWAKK
jgi:superfamily II DNA or RNA helicase